MRERKVANGYAFSADTEWQKEFEEAFQYDETPDQLTAIADIKKDMETPIPMDRLVCGDVGYGKTEVAMRAAFKAGRRRKTGGGARADDGSVLSAFRNVQGTIRRIPGEDRHAEPIRRRQRNRRRFVAELEAGKVDIVIGTHRLLSKDIKFQDLGLMIVDEEQRFGVAHKERLKQIKKQVDVLTMTATPIPRTLEHGAQRSARHVGHRNAAARSAGDSDRCREVQARWSSRMPINFELERGGQVYVVHNRVESIYSLANFIQKTLSEGARRCRPRRRWARRNSRSIMTRFMHHEFDVLVATTIIENGLDIPLANTLIVNRADRLWPVAALSACAAASADRIGVLTPIF